MTREQLIAQARDMYSGPGDADEWARRIVQKLEYAIPDIKTRRREWAVRNGFGGKK